MFILHLITWIQITTVAAYWYFRYPRSLFYRYLLQRLRQENILFTKIFQALTNSTNLDLDTDLRHELRPYTTNASYTESEINYEAIDEAEQLYAVQIDRHVANSGMIALIFNGTDTSGNPVVLKLKRVDIYNRLNEGCDNIGQFYRWIAYWFPQHIIVKALRPFFYNLDEILEQCDFSREIQSMTEAAEDYADLGFIEIPTAINRTNIAEYILMNKLIGSHVLPIDTTEEDRLVYLFKFCLFACFGYVSNAIQHIDLHAGNVIFMPNGNLGIIDFGLAFRPTDEEHDIILSLGELIRGNSQIEDIDVIDIFKDIFVPQLHPDEITDKAAFIKICKDILTTIVDYVNADELNLIDSISRMGVLMNREMTMSSTFYKFILGMMSMGQLYSIMGRTYENHEMLRSIEMRALNRAFFMVM